MWYKKLKQSPVNVMALAQMDLLLSQGTKRSIGDATSKEGQKHE